MVSMGYDLELAELCLKAFQGDIQKATNFFIENRELLKDPNAIKALLSSKLPLSQPLSQNTGETKPSTSQASLEAVVKVKENLEKQKHAKDLLDEIAGEMPEDDEAYLDLNTEEDAFFLNKYYSLLDSFNM